MEHIALGGAEAIYNLTEIQDAFAAIGYEARFLEAPFMRRYGYNGEDSIVEFTKDIPEGYILVPLGEYWVSRAVREPSRCRISRRALEAARSKERLYGLARGAGIEAPRVLDLDGARRALRLGGSVVVKPDGLFSGYGVRVIRPGEGDALDRALYNAGHISNRALKLFEASAGRVLITEAAKGLEMSSDVFFCEGGISIARVCEKRVVLIHGAPCTAVYSLVSAPPAVRASLEAWCRALFDDTDISFAQFDFIVRKDGTPVLIDFAPRVGGGIKELLRSSGRNVYADAVLGAAPAGNGRAEGAHTAPAFMPQGGAPKAQEGAPLRQYNYLPTMSGVIARDDYPLRNGERFVFKHVGDFVPESPTSARSRVASVVARGGDVTDETLQSLLIRAPYIEFWKKS